MGSPVRRPGRVFMNRPFAPSGRMVRNRFAPSGRRFTINPFLHSCGGFFPCNNRFGFRHRFHKRFFFGTGFFPGSFFGASFFPGSFFPFSYIPGFDYDLEYPAYQAEAQPQPVSSDNIADVQVAVQLQRLSDEVEELQEQQQRANTHAEARQPLPPGTSMSAVTPSASTIFVFRDGAASRLRTTPLRAIPCGLLMSMQPKRCLCPIWIVRLRNRPTLPMALNSGCRPLARQNNKI